jgi:hypothetical protein
MHGKEDKNEVKENEANDNKKGKTDIPLSLIWPQLTKEYRYVWS